MNQNQENVVGLHVYPWDSISGIMVSMLTLSVVDREFEPLSGKTKDHKIGICCFSTKEQH